MLQNQFNLRTNTNLIQVTKSILYTLQNQFNLRFKANLIHVSKPTHLEKYLTRLD